MVTGIMNSNTLNMCTTQRQVLSSTGLDLCNKVLCILKVHAWQIQIGTTQTVWVIDERLSICLSGNGQILPMNVKHSLGPEVTVVSR